MIPNINNIRIEIPSLSYSLVEEGGFNDIWNYPELRFAVRSALRTTSDLERDDMFGGSEGVWRCEGHWKSEDLETVTDKAAQFSDWKEADSSGGLCAVPLGSC